MASLRTTLSVEGITILVLAVCLGGLELGFRAMGDRLSGDVAHMENVPDIVGDLQSSSGLRVLLVGNSLLGEGVDPEMLGQRMSDSLGRPVEVAALRPDGTSPLEWYYMLERYVFESDVTPDLIVIPFGPGHLFDRSAEDAVLRLAAHHVSNRAVPYLLAEDLHGFEPRAQFLLARLSRLFALRDRVQPRVLDVLIPQYRELAPLILDADGSDPAQPTPSASNTRDRTLDQVDRITAAARRDGVGLVFLAMPQSGAWQIDGTVEAYLTASDLPLLDFRDELDLPPDQFPDGVHMNDQARASFTAALSDRLLPSLRLRSSQPEVPARND